MAAQVNDIRSIALDINKEGPQILRELGSMLSQYNSRFSAISNALKVYLTENTSSIGDLIASLNQIPEAEIVNFRQNEIFYYLAIAIAFEKKDILVEGICWENVKSKELRQMLRKQTMDILVERDLLRSQQKKIVPNEKPPFADQKPSYPQQPSYIPQGNASSVSSSYYSGQGYGQPSHMYPGNPTQSSSPYSQGQQGNAPSVSSSYYSGQGYGQPSHMYPGNPTQSSSPYSQGYGNPQSIYAPQGYAPHSGSSPSQGQGNAPQSGPSYSQVQQGYGQPSYPSPVNAAPPVSSYSQGQQGNVQPSYPVQGNVSHGQGNASFSPLPGYAPVAVPSAPWPLEERRNDSAVSTQSFLPGVSSPVAPSFQNQGSSSVILASVPPQQPPVAPPLPVAPIPQKNDVQEPVSSSNSSAFFNAQPPAAPVQAPSSRPNPAPFLRQGALLVQLNTYLGSLDEELHASSADTTKQHKRSVAQKLVNYLRNSLTDYVQFSEEEKAVCNDDHELKALVDTAIELFPALKDKLMPTAASLRK